MHKVTVANDNNFPLESFNLKEIKLSAEKAASSLLNCPIKLEDIKMESYLVANKPYASSKSQDISSKLNIPIFKAIFCCIEISFYLNTKKVEVLIEAELRYRVLGFDTIPVAKLVLDPNGKVIKSKIYK